MTGPASLLLLSVLLAGVAGASTSPALLAGARFEAEAPDGVPVAMTFTAPGELELVEADARTRCTFTAEGQGYLWALELVCDGVTLRRDWTWLPSGDVWTDLVDVPGGQLRRVAAPPAAPSEAAGEREPSAPAPPEKPLVEEAPLPFTFARLAGRFEDRRGASFDVLPAGEVRMGEHTAQARLQTCEHVQVEPHPVVPCLTFTDAGGEQVSFALLFDFAWVEGVILPGEGDSKLRYEGFQAGRFFGRVQAPGETED